MSSKELDRIAVIGQMQSKQISQVEASRHLGLSTRQVRRLQRKHEQKGAVSLASKRRGQPSNNQLSSTLKETVVTLIKTHYPDFGPTFANEKLTEQHQLKLSVESTRQLMINEGIWKGKKRKSISIHPQRTRRSCFGELVQIDGSPHDWFEGRAAKCCLIVFIDDATSQLLWLHFAKEESTQAYFSAARAHLEHHGRPLAYYSDRHSIFRINLPEASSGTGETQFGRAMRELDIELICANSPQAKGRVEKANATLQDRLIKEMRLRNISDIQAGNDFLPEFMKDYNKRFSVLPANPTDAHRTTIPDAKTLNLILSPQHLRTISKNLEVSYNNVIYQIQSKTPGYTMRGAKLIVSERGGEITLLYKGKSLSYETLDKSNKPQEILSSKQLNGLEKIRHTKPALGHPWRNAYKQSRQTQVEPVMS